jgi:uncharacterized protein YyaL (SSP411 family)
VIRETANWVLRQMQSSEGAFYSTLDADSEGVEGKYYAWEPGQIKALLGQTVYPLFAEVYGLDRPPNFEHCWHLHIDRDPAEVGARLGLDAADAGKRLEQARGRLLTERYTRVAPGRDEKILTSWNALMIKALFRAGRTLRQRDWTDAADDALTFLRDSLWHEDELYAVYSGGVPRFAAYLDDYAFLLDALLEALQCRWRNEDLEFATELADRLLDHFEDTERGGFYFTADNHEALIYRPKPKSDESTPPGGAVAAFALQRLAQLTDNSRYSDAAERALAAAAGEMEVAPTEHCAFLSALEENLYPPGRVILRGEPELLQKWQARMAEFYLPATAIYGIDLGIASLPPALSQPPPDEAILAYVCEGTVCSEPLYDIDDLIDALKK